FSPLLHLSSGRDGHATCPFEFDDDPRRWARARDVVPSGAANHTIVGRKTHDPRPGPARCARRPVGGGAPSNRSGRGQGRAGGRSGANAAGIATDSHALVSMEPVSVIVRPNVMPWNQAAYARVSSAGSMSPRSW